MNELSIINRINLLRTRKADNSNIVRKLIRKLRRLNVSNDVISEMR